MSDKEKTTSSTAASSTDYPLTQDKAAISGDGGNASVQEQFDEINEQGYFGVTTDPTPDENYTFLGQAKGLPTPESDPKQATKVAEYQRKLATGGM